MIDEADGAALLFRVELLFVCWARDCFELHSMIKVKKKKMYCAMFLESIVKKLC